MDGGMKPPEIAFGPHADNASAVRAAETTKQQPLHKPVKIGEHVTMSPNPDRTAPRTTLRLDPTISGTLLINFIEFCANEKYHDTAVCGRLNRPIYGGAPVCQPSPPFFQNKKAPLPEAYLI